MRIWDCHCHLANETADEVLRAMDAAGIERVNLFSQYPAKGHGRDFAYRREEARAAIDHLAQIQAAAPDRIYGLIWATPWMPGMVEEIEYGLGDCSLRGVKMIPDHWDATEEVAVPIFEKVRDLGKPIQFHSGILYGMGDSSRFCRPVLFEALLNVPGLRFSLAHISWPWVDECIAVFGRFRAAHGSQNNPMWVDTCRGTPDAWRLEALQKAIAFCGSERVMFGVDSHPSGLPTYGKASAEKDLAILRDVMGLSAAQLEQFFWGACEAFWAG
jgi:predicted TIM-barrel fold metal-dependent hydrolase